jgi:iron complex transport system ATP-binding protein
MTRVVVDDLVVRLRRRIVLDGIDLTIDKPELVAVIGPNGAGKTTLLRALAGLIRPDRGEITVDGASLARMGRSERARRLAYLPQGSGVFWPLPVREIVALGRLPHGERPGALSAAGREAVAEAIAVVGLDGFEERPATELSGGERTRALLGRALATKAPVLLADEPVAALDPRHQLLVLTALRERTRRGTVIVAVMHDLALAARFADRIVLLHNRRIAGDGTPVEVLNEALMAEAFGIKVSMSQQAGALVIHPAAASMMTIDGNHHK